MQSKTITARSDAAANGWLKRYYFLRFAVSAGWVALALTIAKDAQVLAAMMLVAYPAWDALANLIDAQRSGGLSSNKTQLFNFGVSVLTAIAVAIALTFSMYAVLAVFGAWAVLSGVLQLATAVRRWKSVGAQWAMILSGAQSALAGVFMAHQASAETLPSIATVAPYAAFGAFYFLVSAVWLTVKDARRRTLTSPA